jgi:hypoxanthine phosphoribosyltransferase
VTNPGSDKCAEGIGRVLIDEWTLQQRVRELAREIQAFYGDRQPLLVGVLTGAFVFMADLARELKIPLRIDFMAVSSYGNATTSSGVVRIMKDLDRAVESESILIVEDIIDSGRTLQYLIELLQQRNPADIRIVALLKKRKHDAIPVSVNWVGFEIPDEFVVGYGLDAAERYRNLPFIAIPDLDHPVNRGVGDGTNGLL